MRCCTRIGKLYAIEAESKHLSTEARQQLRAEKSLSILQSLHDWLLQTRAQTADGGGTAKAIDYTFAGHPTIPDKTGIIMPATPLISVKSIASGTRGMVRTLLTIPISENL